MQTESISEKERKLAAQCMSCPMCKHARAKQKGIVFWFVKKLESGICTACRAYEKVYGRKAHEPVPKSSETNQV